MENKIKPGIFLCIAGIFLFFGTTLLAQTVPDCPPNIGFEKGDFSGWACFTGTLDRGNGSIVSSNSGEIMGRHSVISGASFQQTDPYGNFPIVCPNGSNYSIMLGNSAVGGEVEWISYTFTVPANVKDYSIIYNYAVVFEDPQHEDFEKPRFTAKVYDVATGHYESCGSFDFVASSGLPGFELSGSQGNRAASVYYKPWSAVTLNLSAYAGRTIQLEFTTRDCSRGGHFGYAYIDVNENCTSQITGSAICPESGTSLTLMGPSGFADYYWFNSDFSKVLGRSDQLEVSPIPPVGSVFPLRIVPYQGFGCEDTVYATISSSNEILMLNVPDSIVACRTNPVDLTDSIYTAGSSSSLKYTYYLDPGGRSFLPNPKGIVTSGTYYIKGYIVAGCFIMKPVKVIVNEPPMLVLSNPPPVCFPYTTDITGPQITARSDTNITLTYWHDSKATRRVANPAAIDSSGVYYVKATDEKDCYVIKPLTVVVGKVPVLRLTDQEVCEQANLTMASVKAGSSTGLSYTYWMDQAATIVLRAPDSVRVSGRYYIKGTNSAGCYEIAAVNVVIHQLPQFTVTEPAPVIYPAAINLESLISGSDGQTYTYWKDAAARIPLVNPHAVGITGIYYIKAINKGGCMVIKPVKILILPPEDPTVTSVNTFTPNGDGVNDVFKLDITGFLRVVYFRIYTRWGEAVFETADISRFWDGKANEKDAPVGTYYWVFDSFDDYRNKEVKRSGYITLVR